MTYRVGTYEQAARAAYAHPDGPPHGDGLRYGTTFSHWEVKPHAYVYREGYGDTRIPVPDSYGVVARWRYADRPRAGALWRRLPVVDRRQAGGAGMKVEIFHREPMAVYADEPGGAFVHVANYQAPEGDVFDALEAAWAASQNVDDSWSKGPRAEIEVLAPLPEHGGKVYGHRSSSVGDVFKIGDAYHRVVSIGFEPCEAPACL